MFSDRVIQRTAALKIPSVKSSPEKEQVLALGVGKYIAVMRSFFIWQIRCGTHTISNVLNSMVTVTLPMFDWKCPFADTLHPKNQ